MKTQTLFWRDSCCCRSYVLQIDTPPGRRDTSQPRAQQSALKASRWRADSNVFFPIENRSYCNAFKYMQMIHAVSGLANLDYNINYPSKSAFVLNLSLDYNSN